MALVDVERVYAVFQQFAVSPSTASDTAAGEPYIPAYFLAVATREVGFYPTTSALHQFVKSVPAASEGEVTFAAFLQFCEDVAHTNRLGRSAIYKLVDDLDSRGGGLISRRELFLVLTSGSANISDGEIDAVLDLLDPSLSGYVELKDLAALLLEHCHTQRHSHRSQASRSRSRRGSQARPTTTTTTAAAPAAQTEKAALNSTQPHQKPEHAQPPPRQQRRERSQPRAGADGDGPERRSGRRAGTAAGSDAANAARPPQRGKRAFLTGKNGRAYDRRHEPEPQPPAVSSPAPVAAAGGGGIATSSSTAPSGGAAAATPAAVAERDRSFKRTDIGSNGEVGYHKYGSLHNRLDAFERTQTVMTVDVDGPQSATRTALRQHSRDGLHTPVRTAQPRATPSADGSPLPKAPSANVSTADAAVVAAPASTQRDAAVGADAGAAPGASGASAARAVMGDNDGEANTNADDDETMWYSRVEGRTPVKARDEKSADQAGQLERDEQQQQQQQGSGGAPPPVMPVNPPRTKETRTKCCAMF